MHFDDRLATVLRSRTDRPTTARIQYRQLLDLLGTLPVDAQGPQIDAACDRLGDLGNMIATTDRAAMLREPGLRLRNPRLVALLAGGEPTVAAAAIERAHLSEDEWIDLAPALPAGARGFVRQRRDLGRRAAILFDRTGMTAASLPTADMLVAAAPAHGETPVQPITSTPAPSAPGKTAKPGGIGAIVQRIEDFRKSRETIEKHGETPNQPKADNATQHPDLHLRAFDFATDSEGCIVWSDPGMAPMAIGLRLASGRSGGVPASGAALIQALRLHQPIRALPFEITGAPAIAGRWLIDASPSFDLKSGSYTGHAGRMRRPASVELPQTASTQDSETDRMRQLLHELRTPVNAIQGFAEVIQQQLFGPVPHEYRALAAAIAGDAAHLLAGFEELERFARLEGGGIELAEGACDLAAICTATVAQLAPFTEPRSSGFAANFAGHAPLPVAFGQADCERLIWRLLATLAGAASPGEVLSLQGQSQSGNAVLTVQLPASLAVLNESQLMQATASTAPRAVMAGMFGTGFSFRLAAAEARSAGGSLRQSGKVLELRLPGLTAAAPGHSDESGNRSVL